jgi:hypothetical protein
MELVLLGIAWVPGGFVSESLKSDLIGPLLLPSHPYEISRHALNLRRKAANLLSNV